MRTHLKTALKAAPVLSLVVLASAANAAVTIPDTGLDISGYVTAGIVAIGGVVATCVGGYFAFLVIKRGIRWAGKALG